MNSAEKLAQALHADPGEGGKAFAGIQGKAKDPWPDTRDGKYAKMLEAALAASSCGTHGSFGTRFARAINGTAQKAEYEACPNNAARAEFRKKWAEAELQVLVSKYQEAKSYEIVDSTIGEYLPFPVIVEREGGWCMEQNVLAAIRYVKKAHSMGGNWVSYNEMSERAEFLYCRKQHRETFAQKWEHYLCSADQSAAKAINRAERL